MFLVVLSLHNPVEGITNGVYSVPEFVYVCQALLGSQPLVSSEDMCFVCFTPSRRVVLLKSVDVRAEDPVVVREIPKLGVDVPWEVR